MVNRDERIENNLHLKITWCIWKRKQWDWIKYFGVGGGGYVYICVGLHVSVTTVGLKDCETHIKEPILIFGILKKCS